MNRTHQSLQNLKLVDADDTHIGQTNPAIVRYLRHFREAFFAHFFKKTPKSIADKKIIRTFAALKPEIISRHAVIELN